MIHEHFEQLELIMRDCCVHVLYTQHTFSNLYSSSVFILQATRYIELDIKSLKSSFKNHIIAYAFHLYFYHFSACRVNKVYIFKQFRSHCKNCVNRQNLAILYTYTHHTVNTTLMMLYLYEVNMQ